MHYFTSIITFAPELAKSCAKTADVVLIAAKAAGHSPAALPDKTIDWLAITAQEEYHKKITFSFSRQTCKKI